MKIIIAFLIAALFFLVLKVIRLGLKSLSNRFTGVKFSDNLRITIELIIWLVYIFWAMEFLFKGKFFYPYLIYSLIVVVTGLVTWFLLKDIFAGIILMVRHNLKTGSYIRAGDFSGQIETHKLTYLKILTGDGQILRVPYSRIINEVITELAFPGTLAEHIIHLHVELSSGSAMMAESMIRNTVLNNPWSNLKEEPSISLMKENEEGYFFEITLLSINMKQMKYIEMAFEEIPSLHVIK